MTPNDARPGPGPRARRVLRAMLPAGVVLLVLWVAYAVAVVAVGGVQVGLTLASAVLGFLTSSCLIVVGRGYRRELDRR